MNALYRVWCDPRYNKGEDEARDGEVYEASGPEQAAVSFAEARYSRLQHIDPGVVLVRAPDETVSSWSVGFRMLFTASPREYSNE